MRLRGGGPQGLVKTPLVRKPAKGALNCKKGQTIAAAAAAAAHGKPTAAAAAAAATRGAPPRR